MSFILWQSLSTVRFINGEIKVVWDFCWFSQKNENIQGFNFQKALVNFICLAIQYKSFCRDIAGFDASGIL